MGRKNLPLGKREVLEVSAKEAVQLRRFMRRYRWANTPPEKRKFLRKSQLWSQDFTAKLFCNVEFWIERLPRLIWVAEARKRMPPLATAESEKKHGLIAFLPRPWISQTHTQKAPCSRWL